MKKDKEDIWSPERIKNAVEHKQFLQVLQVTPPYNKLMRILSNATKPLDKLEIANAMYGISMEVECNPKPIPAVEVLKHKHITNEILMPEQVTDLDGYEKRQRDFKEHTLKQLCKPITEMLLYLNTNGIVFIRIAQTNIGKLQADVAYYTLMDKKDLFDGVGKKVGD